MKLAAAAMVLTAASASHASGIVGVNIHGVGVVTSVCEEFVTCPDQPFPIQPNDHFPPVGTTFTFEARARPAPGDTIPFGATIAGQSVDGDADPFEQPSVGISFEFSNGSSYSVCSSCGYYFGGATETFAPATMAVTGFDLDLYEDISDEYLNLSGGTFTAKIGFYGDPAFAGTYRVTGSSLIRGPVPEPGSWLLLGSGFAAVGGVWRRRARAIARELPA